MREFSTIDDMKALRSAFGHGENLELLDELIASRPKMGVPGLDYPVTEPWAASQEGLWFFTDNELPKPMRTYLERSRATDPAARAVAALKMVVAARVEPKKDIREGHARLHELLEDPDLDVRRAAGSALGEWRDLDALDAVLGLLETETEPTPFAVAAVFIALDAPKADKDRVLAALERFAEKSPQADAQAAQLGWRLMGERAHA